LYPDARFISALGIARRRLLSVVKGDFASGRNEVRLQVAGGAGECVQASAALSVEGDEQWLGGQIAVEAAGVVHLWHETGVGEIQHDRDALAG